ncbi:MAG: CD225/dispanin family protein [Muribaculum sp.]|nr:CD225/dispanin family protein [Muribaculum sp.]
MKYYIAEGTTPVGPFEIDELVNRGISPDTLVWAAGMTDWKPAHTIDELQGLFEPVPPPLTPPEPPVSAYSEPTPPPYNPTEYQPTSDIPTKPFDWMWAAIIITICCCSPIAIVGIIYGAQANGRWNRGEYDAAYKDFDKSRIWTLVALVLTVVANILYLAFYPSLLSSL